MSDSMCAGCHGGCCRAFATPISGADVIRMEDRLGLEFWEFACRWADPAGTIARGRAPHFHFEDDPQTPFVICLAHEASAMHPGTTRCRFLVESEPDAEYPRGIARCGIYDSRPASCRGFPAKLSDDRHLVVLGDLPRTGSRGDHAAYELCPRPWTPEDADPIQLAQDLVVLQYELEFFRQIATVWNRARGPWLVFPEFLRAVYRRRVVTESSQDADQNGRMDEVATIAFPRAARVDTQAA